MIFMVFKIKSQSGNDFYKALINSKMGLNLSEGCQQNIIQVIE